MTAARAAVPSRLTVLGEAGTDKRGRRLIRVQCSCGSPPRVLVYRSFHYNRTLSCGCLQRERAGEVNFRHGHQAQGQKTPEYDAWRSMLERCSNEKVESYPYYGGRGISVCRRWRESFEAFLADVGVRPSDEHLLCLLDKSKDFKPGNAKWLTRHEADRKRRDNTMYTVGNVTKCLVDWAAEYSIPKSTLHYRVVIRGMTMRDALDIGRGRSGKRLPGVTIGQERAP